MSEQGAPIAVAEFQPAPSTAIAPDVRTDRPDAPAAPIGGPRLHLASIDALRGLAALMVFAHHAYGFFWRTNVELDRHTLHGLSEQYGVAGTIGWLATNPMWAGLNLFFLVSGFCIHLPYAMTRGRVGPRAYAVRRFVRLYPTYLVALAVAFPLVVVKYGWGNQQATAANLIGHLVFWYYNGGSISDGSTAVNPVLWTIGLEVQFYLFYLLVRPLFPRFGIATVTAAFVAVGVLAHVAGQWAVSHGMHVPPPLHPNVFAPVRFGEWMLGALLADHVLRRPAGARPSAAARAGLYVGAAVLLVTGIVLPWACRWERSATNPLVTGAFVLLMLAVVGGGDSRPAAANRAGSVASRVLGWVGLRCYTLYLFHFIVLAAVGELYVRARGYPPGRKAELGGSAEWALVTVAAIAVVFLVVEVVYRTVEVPSHRLARRWGKRLEPS